MLNKLTSNASQEAYEEAYREVFAELDHIDAHLADNRYLLGCLRGFECQLGFMTRPWVHQA